MKKPRIRMETHLGFVEVCTANQQRLVTDGIKELQRLVTDTWRSESGGVRSASAALERQTREYRRTAVASGVRSKGTTLERQSREKGVGWWSGNWEVGNGFGN
ncbi:hypothetical protein ACOSQ3_005157 [Xanthoceras sorbifolium]